MVDASTKKTLASIPLLKTNAGPRDEAWPERQKEELLALITVRAALVFPVCFVSACFVTGLASLLRKRKVAMFFSPRARRAEYEQPPRHSPASPST